MRPNGNENNYKLKNVKKIKTINDRPRKIALKKNHCKEKKHTIKHKEKVNVKP